MYSSTDPEGIGGQGANDQVSFLLDSETRKLADDEMVPSKPELIEVLID